VIEDPEIVTLMADTVLKVIDLEVQARLKLPPNSVKVLPPLRGPFIG
jgi:hypothetical protein